MVIVSFGTADGVYDRYLERLRASCEAVDLPHDLRTFPPLPTEEAIRRKPAFIAEMLHEHRQPVLWLDADAVVAASFALPPSGWDIGLLPNNRLFHRRALPVAAFAVAVAPTEAARAFLDRWSEACHRPGLNDHSSLPILREELAGQYAELDLSRALERAVIRDKGRPKEAMVLRGRDVVLHQPAAIATWLFRRARLIINKRLGIR